MSRRLAFNLSVLALVALVVVAAFSARQHPVASGLAFAFVSASLALRFYLQRRSEAVVAAADRGDLEALASLEVRSVQARYDALVALAVFETADAVLARPHRACFCGDDCGNVLNDDVHAILTAVASFQAGHHPRALAQLRARVTSEDATGTFALNQRAIVRDLLTCIVMLDVDRLNERAEIDALLGDVPPKARFLRGPLQLAIASWRLRHGDAAGARALLDALPPWKAGSRLATKRDEVARESGSVA